MIVEFGDVLTCMISMIDLLALISMVDLLALVEK